MALRMHRVQVWSADVPERVGAAAAKLEVLARAAPIEGPEQTAAAQAAGFTPAQDTAMLCVEGQNRSGIGFELMSRLAVAGLNLGGLSISLVGDRFAAYLAFDDTDTAMQAIQVLASVEA